MMIIRITLKEGEGSKVTLLRKEKRIVSLAFASEMWRTTTQNKKEELRR